jgi:group II intron reverse transcriptase/maturase
MRNAETVLAVIRERGKRGLPLDDVYRQLFNPSLYLRAYSRIYANHGAMTRGVTEETVDGMSLRKIDTIIEQLRNERYRWTPVRRTEIPKKNGKTRPLGIPTWSDKLLQEVMRLILEAYYEPQFSDTSHGFRPDRGCHTALRTVRHEWTGTKWFVEGDLRGCFDNIDHNILMSILRKKIADNRFLRLIEHLLKAGYLEQWKYNCTMSGVPQGGIVSPILSNIYLDQLDRYVEQTLIPTYTRGKKRQDNAEYDQLCKRAWYLRKTGRREEARELETQYQKMPSVDTSDPGYRRLQYVRYADDWLIGFIGPVAEAREIKDHLESFLKEHLNLELSEEKTLITQASTHAAKFLGYDIVTYSDDTKHSKGRRSINGRIGLRVPAKFVEEKCSQFMHDGMVMHRPEIVNDSDYSIVATYQSQYRGYVQYYKLAANLAWLGRLHWVMQTSLLKTLACKHKSTLGKMAKKYRTVVKFPYGPRKCLEVTVPREGKSALVARFGGLSLQCEPYAVIEDIPTGIVRASRSEILTRLLADTCELCGSNERVEVHHVRALKDLHIPGQQEKPFWMQIMSARKRKTLVVCRNCHETIHNGKL